jgi:DNA-binding NarL/FixJ family response regulator
VDAAAKKIDRGLRAVPLTDARRATVRVSVLATDPLARAGVVGELRDRPGIQVVDSHATTGVDVVVAVVDPAGRVPEVIADVRSNLRLVLVADRPSPAEVLAAVERGLVVLVPRHEVSAVRLMRAITDARRGHGDLPPEELGQLLRQLTRLHRDVLSPRGISLSGLSPREAEVLRLLADGLDTAEIAEEMTYSERTVKNILHGVLSRLGLRNRTHAVAYALREGLI